MSSASTFAHNVVELLQGVSQLKRVRFQLFFAGHCVGGWLAQVTTLTTQHLKREENLFI
jgi:surfactin synthase thioesterase subunit